MPKQNATELELKSPFYKVSYRTDVFPFTMLEAGILRSRSKSDMDEMDEFSRNVVLDT